MDYQRIQECKDCKKTKAKAKAEQEEKAKRATHARLHPFVRPERERIQKESRKSSGDSGFKRPQAPLQKSGFLFKQKPTERFKYEPYLSKASVFPNTNLLDEEGSKEHETDRDIGPQAVQIDLRHGEDPHRSLVVKCHVR